MTNLSIVIRASNLVPVCPIARKLVALQADNHPSVFWSQCGPCMSHFPRDCCRLIAEMVAGLYCTVNVPLCPHCLELLPVCLVLSNSFMLTVVDIVDNADGEGVLVCSL